MSEMPTRGVVVAHAALAHGLVDAVQRIAGIEEDALVAFSNEGLSTVGIREGLTRLIDDGPAILFTDLREGSCGIAARQVCMDGPDRALISGVNLPLLLDFAMKRSSMPLRELVPRLVDRGRAAISALSLPE